MNRVQNKMRICWRFFSYHWIWGQFFEACFRILSCQYTVNLMNLNTKCALIEANLLPSWSTNIFYVFLFVQNIQYNDIRRLIGKKGSINCKAKFGLWAFLHEKENIHRDEIFWFDHLFPSETWPCMIVYYKESSHLPSETIEIS